MEDRIEINGVWYVREDTNTNDLQRGEFEIMYSHEMCIETDTFRMTATVGVDNPDKFEYPCIIYKRKEKGVEHYNWVTQDWDNLDFLIGVANLEEHQLIHLREGLTYEEQLAGVQLCQRMKELGWLE